MSGFGCIIHFWLTMIQQLHVNDRKAIASQFSLTLKGFDSLVQSANHAYDFLKVMGPFYGQIQEPTFRVAAEPIRLPLGSKKKMTQFGNDLIVVGKALTKLPARYKRMIGDGLDFRIPLTFRIDAILGNDYQLHVNEIEGNDGASALMMIEQLTYGLQTLDETTAGRLIASLKKLHPTQGKIKIAFLRTNILENPYAVNVRRFMELIHDISKKSVTCSFFDSNDLQTGKINPQWDTYAAVFNETYFSPETLYEFGITKEQLYGAGNYNTLVNKGVFALVHERALKRFWIKEIGQDRYERITTQLIRSHFITTSSELEEARLEGKVVKVTWAKDDMSVANRSQGVGIPTGNITHSTDERWEFLKTCLQKGYTLISQDYIEPVKIHAFLRKKGTSLEPVEWYNRVCVKYVCGGDPDGQETPEVHLTATEVTLGPDVVPAGRKCAFTAGILS